MQLCSLKLNGAAPYVEQIWSITGDVSLQRQAALSDRLILEGDLVLYIAQQYPTAQLLPMYCNDNP